MQLPTEDRHSYTKEFLCNRLAVLMGGRVAEELVFKHVTTGAGNDLNQATDLARKMVCEWGMSDKLGPLTFGQKTTRYSWGGTGLPKGTSANELRRRLISRSSSLSLKTTSEPSKC